MESRRLVLVVFCHGANRRERVEQYSRQVEFYPVPIWRPRETHVHSRRSVSGYILLFSLWTIYFFLIIYLPMIPVSFPVPTALHTYESTL
ncbi:hypothetical protein YC2023_084264 [Brassica napus]